MRPGSFQVFELYLRADDPQRVRTALSALSTQATETGFMLPVGRAETGLTATLVTLPLEANRDEVRAFLGSLAIVVDEHQLTVDGFDVRPTAEALAERYDAWRAEASRPDARLTGVRVRFRERVGFWLAGLFLFLSLIVGACAYVAPAVGEHLSGIHF